MKGKKQERADIMLHEQGSASSREEAKRLIMAGVVFCGSERVSKPGARYAVDEVLQVRAALHPFVGRGGVKLQRALDVFQVSLSGRVVLDVGASTGGFTDCALRAGASVVYAVDVGYGQLAWKLRTDPRVRVFERTNFRHMEVDVFSPRPDAAVMDVSFISIVKLLPRLAAALLPDSPVVALVKPQFEAGPDKVGKGGVVRDPQIHEEVLHRVLRQSGDLGFVALGATRSPILGGDGNREFLLWLQSPPTARAAVDIDVPAVVAPPVAAESGRHE